MGYSRGNVRPATISRDHDGGSRCGGMRRITWFVWLRKAARSGVMPALMANAEENRDSGTGALGLAYGYSPLHVPVVGRKMNPTTHPF